MFIVKDYTYGAPYLYYCRTIEKAKEIFEKIFWEWVEEETLEPADYNADTWEELLVTCWENDMDCDDVVQCVPIRFEEDKIGA